MIKDPLVSIIIVNYNGKFYVERCIKAVFNNNYSNFEVIVVDNGSNDGSVNFLKEIEKEKNDFKAILLDKNYGPAYARNRGVEKAKGKYIAFLDNDTVPDENWLIPLVEVMEKDENIGACQCKLLFLNDPKKIDYIGDYLSQFGFLVQPVHGGEIDEEQFNRRVEILSAKSAGMFIRKEVFRNIGGFDEDYFIYLEETDLGWRTWLAGYRVILVPESKVYHEFGTTIEIAPQLQTYNSKFHGSKNYVTTLIKNLELANLMKILPLHILLWIGIAFWIAIMRGRFYEAGLILKGMLWNISHLPITLKKRAIIQSRRRVCDKELFPKIMKKKKFSYFYNKLTNVCKIGHAKGW